jgi:hypothetical protein
MFAPDRKPWRLSNINFFHQIPIEKGGLYAHVMHSLVFKRRHVKNEPHGLHPRHQCESFFIVNPLSLHVPFSDKPRFVLNNATLFILLHLVHPFEADRVMIGWEINNVQCAVVFN